jgi:HK97 family phage major capsid protein
MALLTSGATAILTPAQVSELVVRPVIEQAVSAQVSTVIQIGTHELRIPIVTADPNASFVAEGSEIPASDAAVTERDPEEGGRAEHHQLGAGQR